MSFWIFMLVMNLLIPLFMLVFGRRFMKHAPREINFWFGYRTSMSMKNKDTWEFAHKIFGKIWYKSGAVLITVTIIAMLFLINKDIDTVGAVGGIIVGVQLAVMLLTIVPVEMALRKAFDSRGNRRESDN